MIWMSFDNINNRDFGRFSVLYVEDLRTTRNMLMYVLYRRGRL
jgi:hypothetical protein